MEAALRKEGISVKGKFLVKEARTLILLGYVIGHGRKNPGYNRLHPLLELSSPGNIRDLRSVMGIFGYYRSWIENFDDKISPLNKVGKFPLHGIALEVFTP